MTDEHWIVYFKCVNCVVCEFYLSKAGKRKVGAEDYTHHGEGGGNPQICSTK